MLLIITALFLLWQENSRGKFKNTESKSTVWAVGTPVIQYLYRALNWSDAAWRRCHIFLLEETRGVADKAVTPCCRGVKGAFGHIDSSQSAHIVFHRSMSTFATTLAFLWFLFWVGGLLICSPVFQLEGCNFFGTPAGHGIPAGVPRYGSQSHS